MWVADVKRICSTNSRACGHKPTMHAKLHAFGACLWGGAMYPTRCQGLQHITQPFASRSIGMGGCALLRGCQTYVGLCPTSTWLTSYGHISKPAGAVGALQGLRAPLYVPRGPLTLL